MTAEHFAEIVQAEFDVRVVDIDREGYYYPRWDRATPMTVTAPHRQAAINLACDLMGDPPRGRYWGVQVDAIRIVLRPDKPGADQ